MKPLFQSITTTDDTQTGDCWRTAIACLLDLQNPARVPHFAQIARGREGSLDAITKEWLRIVHKLDLMHFAIQTDKLGSLETMLRGNTAILCGQSTRGEWGHCTIVADGEIVHDVMLGGEGVEPFDDAGIGLHYDIYVLTRYSPSLRQKHDRQIARIEQINRVQQEENWGKVAFASALFDRPVTVVGRTKNYWTVDAFDEKERTKWSSAGYGEQDWGGIGFLGLL